MCHRQYQAALLGQPVVGITIATLWTATITAGVITVMVLTTVVTPINLSTEHFSATGFNISHRLAVTGQHMLTILRPICWPVKAKDVSEFDPLDSVYPSGLNV